MTWIYDSTSPTYKKWDSCSLLTSYKKTSSLILSNNSYKKIDYVISIYWEHFAIHLLEIYSFSTNKKIMSGLKHVVSQIILSHLNLKWSYSYISYVVFIIIDNLQLVYRWIQKKKKMIHSMIFPFLKYLNFNLICFSSSTLLDWISYSPLITL